MKYNRVFTFGCSFTSYWWLTWPDILAQEFQIPVYNYGLSGAGNQYIFNTFCQADSKHKIDGNDLVITSWTNVCREDRFLAKQGWITPGNIFTQDIFDKKYVNKWVDPVGFLLRDIASIHCTTKYLKEKGTEHYNLQMCEIIEQSDQQSFNNKIDGDSNYNKILDVYKETINTLRPGFMEVLWNNDIYTNKLLQDPQKFGRFSDGHPSPEEHLKYIQTVLPFEYSDNTLRKVQECQNNLEKIMIEKSNEIGKEFYIFELSDSEQNKIKQTCSLNLTITPDFI